MNRNSLAVQWLGLQLSLSRAQVQSLTGELRSSQAHSMAKKKKKQVEMEKVEDRVPEGGRIGDEEEVETGRELN